MIYLIYATLGETYIFDEILLTLIINRLVSQRGDQNYPPRLCDLNPLDFFIGVMLKLTSMKINHEPSKKSICRVISELDKNTLCQQVIDNFVAKTELVTEGEVEI